MRVVIDIPDEQVKKSLEESKYIHEDEGEKGYVQIVMLYTNTRLEFVNVERKTDFYSCEYKVLPKRHGRLIDADAINIHDVSPIYEMEVYGVTQDDIEHEPTIIKADAPKRRKGTPREDYEPLYDCENWIP